jgi:hypothetical protein
MEFLYRPKQRLSDITSDATYIAGPAENNKRKRSGKKQGSK